MSKLASYLTSAGIGVALVAFAWLPFLAGVACPKWMMPALALLVAGLCFATQQRRMPADSMAPFLAGAAMSLPVVFL